MMNFLFKSRVYHQVFRYKSTKISRKPLKIVHLSQSESLVKSTIEDELSFERKILRSAKKTELMPDFKSQSIKNILCMSTRARDENNVIILEGKRLIKEALLCGLNLHDLFYANPELVNDPVMNIIPPDKKTMVSEKVLKLWSLLSTCPGILGIFEKPTPILEEEDPNYPITVICDNVRDPGNMGSLIRCASAAGCKTILLTKGCVDIWDRKVLRASAGAHFRLNLESKLLWDDIEKLVKYSQIYFADIFESPNIVESCEMSVYTKVKFNKEKTALVIGGETHGVSQDAKKLVQKKGGFGLTIPMQNNTNSLNSATALGIILFEIRRQFEYVSL